MKKTIMIILFLAGILYPLTAGETSYSLAIDWQLSVQGGIEHRFNDSIGIEGSLGASLTGLIAAECYLLYDASLLPDPWFDMFLIGIPNFFLVPTFEGAMLSLGGAAEAGRMLGDTLALSLRAGAGFPIFFEGGGVTVRDTNFPLGIWPEVSILLSFR